MPPVLEIVVCTYNRAPLLALNLEALLPEAADSGVSVLVVDNNSSDETPDVARRFQAEFPGLRYVFEPEQGLSHARNRGFRESGAEWVGYLDDDARIHPGWVARALAVAGGGDFDCFGGVFLPWHHFSGRPHWFPEESAGNGHIQKHYGELPADAFPSGGNFFCRRDLLEKMNGFDPKLGMSGARCGYGEETELVARLRSARARVGFVPNLVVDHCVVPAKYRMAWHFASAHAKGRASWKLTGKRPTIGKALSLVLSLPFIILRDAGRGVARLKKEGALTPRAWFFFVGYRTAKRLGRIAGCFASEPPPKPPL